MSLGAMAEFRLSRAPHEPLAVTVHSSSVLLIICRTPPRDTFSWGELPKTLLCCSSDNNVIHFRVSKGTLVPMDADTINVQGGIKRGAADVEELMAEQKAAAGTPPAASPRG